MGRKKTEETRGVSGASTGSTTRNRPRAPAGGKVKGSPSDLLTHGDYARSRGITDRRVRQLIAEGMPTLDAGLLDAAAADAWRKLHTRDYTKRRPTSQTTLPATSPVMSAVAKVLGEHGHDVDDGEAIGLDKIRLADEALGVARKHLELERRRGNLVDRQSTLGAVFTWARARRDRLERWPGEIVADLAAELGCDAGTLRRALDERVRVLLEGEALEAFRLAGVEPDVDEDGDAERAE